MSYPARYAARASELVKLGLSFNGLICIFENSFGPGMTAGAKAGIRGGSSPCQTGTRLEHWGFRRSLGGSIRHEPQIRPQSGLAEGTRQLTLAVAFFIHPPQP